MAFRVGVLVSGEGTNLQALLDRVHGTDGIEVAGVGSSRRGARALERAARAGIETAVFEAGAYADREARDLALGDWLESLDVDLVVLAGFMELLSAAFIRRFGRRILNVHPALLPSFPGLRAVEQALEHGVRITGVTVHFVDEGVDTGPVVLQEPLEVSYPTSADEVGERLHEIEHRLLPEAVRLIAQGRVRLDPDNPRLVLIDRGGPAGG